MLKEFVQPLAAPSDSFHQRLTTVLDRVPQTTPGGSLRYLVHSGGARYLTTGNGYPSDLDVLILRTDPVLQRILEAEDVDVIPYDDCFAGKPLYPKFLANNAHKVLFDTTHGPTVPVIVTHPAVEVLRRSTSYFFGGQEFPRLPKDVIAREDGVSHWLYNTADPVTWYPIMYTAAGTLDNDTRSTSFKTLSATKQKIIAQNDLKEKTQAQSEINPFVGPPLVDMPSGHVEPLTNGPLPVVNEVPANIVDKNTQERVIVASSIFKKSHPVEETTQANVDLAA